MFAVCAENESTVSISRKQECGLGGGQPLSPATASAFLASLIPKEAVEELLAKSRCPHCGGVLLTLGVFGCPSCRSGPELPPDRSWVEFEPHPFDIGCRSVHCWVAVALAVAAIGLAVALLGMVVAYR